MASPIKFVVTRQNALGEVLSAEVQVDSRKEVAELAAAVTPVLTIIDARMREMNRRVLAANSRIKDAGGDVMKEWYEALDMLYGYAQAPEEVERKVAEAPGGEREVTQ